MRMVSSGCVIPIHLPPPRPSPSPCCGSPRERSPLSHCSPLIFHGFWGVQEWLEPVVFFLCAVDNTSQAWTIEIEASFDVVSTKPVGGQVTIAIPELKTQQANHIELQHGQRTVKLLVKIRKVSDVTSWEVLDECICWSRDEMAKWRWGWLSTSSLYFLRHFLTLFYF